LIISTGSTTFYPNKVIARKLGVPNIAILNPKGYRLDFSKILCPAYDHPPKRENIIELPLNLCAADASFFETKAKEFRAKHTQQKPAVGFIIGGPNAVSAIDAQEIKKRLEQAFELTKDCEHWVTTSRRTPADVEAVIESMPFDYRLINSRDPYNPVPAFIQLCDQLFVTSDSASMISECASFGRANVEILLNRQLKTPNKFEELIQGLEKRSAVHIFDGNLGTTNVKIDLTPYMDPLRQLLPEQPSEPL
jgi:mitochondrial fission protein ELM1